MLDPAACTQGFYCSEPEVYELFTKPRPRDDVIPMESQPECLKELLLVFERHIELQM